MTILKFEGITPLKTYYFVLNEHHVPIPASREEWWAFANSRAAIVAETPIGGGTLTTRFEGVSDEDDDDPPLLFATYSKHGDDNPWEEDFYPTWEEAEAGHRDILARYERV